MGLVAQDVEDRAEVWEILKRFLGNWSEEGDFPAQFVPSCLSGLMGHGVELWFNMTENGQSHITNITFTFLLPSKATQGVDRGRLHPFVHSWSPTTGVLNAQTSLVSGRGPTALGHVPPMKICSTCSPGCLTLSCCSYRHTGLNYLPPVFCLEP